MTIGFTLRAATSASALGLLLAAAPAAAQNPADHSSHAAPIASVAAGAP